MNKKSVLLTGASSGFGLLALELLLKRGHTVLAGVRGGLERWKELHLPQLDSFLQSKQLFVADMHMEREESFASAEMIIREYLDSRLDVLINNAGFGLVGPVECVGDQALRHQFNVNFFGPMQLCQALLPYLKKSQGRIINVSSILGKATLPMQGPYCATKYALESYTEALYYDMKHFGVQVSLLEPGSFRTNFIRDIKQDENSLKKDPIYAKMHQDFHNFLHLRANKTAADPSKVARLMVQMVERRKIPLRTIVGLDALVMSLIIKILPSNWRAALISWIYRHLIFR